MKKSKTLTISSLSEGSCCVTRNGRYDISGIIVEEGEDGMVSVEFVSKRLKRCLNSGFTIGAEDMDAFARQWHRMRGARAGSAPAQEILKKMDECMAELRKRL